MSHKRFLEETTDAPKYRTFIKWVFAKNSFTFTEAADFFALTRKRESPWIEIDKLLDQGILIEDRTTTEPSFKVNGLPLLLPANDLNGKPIYTTTGVVSSMLIIGKHGSGKTFFVRRFIKNNRTLALRGESIKDGLIISTTIDCSSFEIRNNTSEPSKRATKFLMELSDEYSRRRELKSSGQVKTFPFQIFVIEGLSALLHSVPNALSLISLVLREGKELSIFVVATDLGDNLLDFSLDFSSIITLGPNEKNMYYRLFDYRYHGEGENIFTPDYGLLLLNDKIQRVALPPDESKVSQQDFLKKESEWLASSDSYPDYITYSEYLCIECGTIFFSSDIKSQCKKCHHDNEQSFEVGKKTLMMINTCFTHGITSYDQWISSLYGLKTNNKNNANKLSPNRLLTHSFVLMIADSIEINNNSLSLEISQFYCLQYKKFIEENNKPKHIKRILVKGLFGYYSYHLDFDDSNNISVIYGPNGFGKTTLFKLMDAILTRGDKETIWQHLSLLQSVPFELFEIQISSNLTISANKADGKLIFNYKSDNLSLENNQIIIDFNRLSKNSSIFKASKHYEIIKRVFPELSADKKRFLFIKTKRDNATMTATAISKLVLNRGSSYIENKLKTNEQYLENVAKQTVMPVFAKEFRNTIDDYSMKISSNLIDLRNYCVHRGFYEYGSLAIGKETYGKLNEIIKSGFCSLMRIAVSPSENELLIRDKVFLNKFIILQNQINDLYKMYRSYLCFKNAFESFYDHYNPSRKSILALAGNLTITDYEGKEVGFDELSSGELNIVSILYDAVFGTTDNSILLIDEPEISLHIVWQQQFIDALLEAIKNKSNVQIIIASHSPFITSSRDDLLVDAQPDDEDFNE